MVAVAEAASEEAVTSVAEVAATSIAIAAPDPAAAEAALTTEETTERDPTGVTESEPLAVIYRAEQRTNELIHSQDARERRRSECTGQPITTLSAIRRRGEPPQNDAIPTAVCPPSV